MFRVGKFEHFFKVTQVTGNRGTLFGLNNFFNLLYIRNKIWRRPQTNIM